MMLLSPKECLGLVQELNTNHERGGGGMDCDGLKKITRYLTDLNNALKRGIEEQRLRGVSEVSVSIPPLTGKIISGVLTSNVALPSPHTAEREAAHGEMISAMFAVCATLSQVPALRGWACCVLSDAMRPIRQSPRAFQSDPVGASFIDGLLLRSEPPLKRMSFLLPPEPASAAQDEEEKKKSARETADKPQGEPEDGAAAADRSSPPDARDDMPCLCDETPDDLFAPALTSMSGQVIYECVVRSIAQRVVDNPGNSRVGRRLAESPALWAQFLEAARHCCLTAAPVVTSQLSPLVAAARVLTAGVRRCFAEAGRPEAFYGLFGPRRRSLVRLLATMPRFSAKAVCVPAFRARWLRDVERICAEFLAPGNYSPELWFVVVVLFGAWASFAFNALRYLVCAAAPVPRFLSQFVAWTLVPPRTYTGRGEDPALLRTEFGSFLTSCTLDPSIVLRMEFLPAPLRRYWALVDYSCRCALLTAKGLRSEEELPVGCADPVFLDFEVGDASGHFCCENHKAFARTLFMSV